MASAFQDEYTSPRGTAYFVSVDPVFSEQITEAVNLIARSRPENVRVSYISQFSTAAQAAAPPAAEDAQGDAEEEDDDDEDDDEPARGKKVVDESSETRDAKRKVFKDLLDSLKGLKIEASDREFEGLANLLLSLLFTLFPSDHADVPNLVLALVDTTTVTGERIANPSLSSRYTAIANIFNSLPLPTATSSSESTPVNPTPSSVSTLRLSVLLKLVAFAASNDDLTVLKPTLARLESWLVEWGFALGSSGEEEGNAAISQVAKTLASKGKKDAARELILSHLALAKSGSSTSASAANLSSQAIAITLSLPTIFALAPLSTLPAPSSATLKELLTIFQSGDLEAFSSFAGKNADALKEFELEPEALEKKLKLFKLAELCSEKVGQQVSYAEIAAALQIKEEQDDGEQVETWVIDAIRASLVSGRLSQPQQTFHVTRAAPRSFTSQHWVQLQDRLQGWRTALDGILTTVNKAAGPSGEKKEDRSAPVPASQVEASPAAIAV